MFKKTFLKLSLQKYLDKRYSKCCKIFKAYLAIRRVNFVGTHFNYLAVKLLLLIFLNVLIYHSKNCLLICRKGLFLFDRDMRITIVQFNKNSYWKQLRPVTILKERLYLRRFLASFVNFYMATAFETLANYFTNF